MKITATQYLRPDGATRSVSTEIDDTLAGKFNEITEAGCRITVEELATHNVAAFIEHEYGDYDLSITVNGPEVRVGLEQMIARFDRAGFDRWLKDQH